MRRRSLITGVAAVGVVGWGSPAAAEALRHDLSTAIAADGEAGSRCADSCEWERIAAGYGTAYAMVPPRTLLRDLAVDLTHARDHLGHLTGGTSRGDAERATMFRVIAQLTGLVAQVVSNLGDVPTSLRWWRTATQAADACGDPEVRTWVRGREIVHGLYDHRPLATLLDLADQSDAIAVEAGRGTAGLRPCGPGSAWTAGGRAQALAMAGRAQEALATLNRLDAYTGLLPDGTSSGGEPLSIYGWSQIRLLHTDSYVRTFLTDDREATQAQDRAIAAYPDPAARGCVQVRLHRAVHLVRQGDLGRGIGYALSVLDAVPAAQRSSMVLEIARQALAAVPYGQRGRADVADLRSLVAVSEVNALVAPSVSPSIPASPATSSAVGWATPSGSSPAEGSAGTAWS